MFPVASKSGGLGKPPYNAAPPVGQVSQPAVMSCQVIIPPVPMGKGGGLGKPPYNGALSVGQVSQPAIIFPMVGAILFQHHILYA